MDKVSLRNGVELPTVGLGTYKMTAEQVLSSVPIAYENGYRLFDTAAVYKNESSVAQALSPFARESYFITTKLAPRDQGYEKAKAAISKSLYQLRSYIDLYLVHWPGASGLDPTDPQNALLRLSTWKAVEEAYESGSLKSIGVSNYEIRHLQEMRKYANIMPMVNQIEVHPLYFPTELIEYCHQEGIVVQAYSSLAANRLISQEYLEKYPVISEIAKAYEKTPAQILLKWALQHNLPIIPKSTQESRIRENISLNFRLSDSEMHQLDNLNCNQKVCWDPSVVI